MRSETSSKIILTLDPKWLAIVLTLPIPFLAFAHIAGLLTYNYFGIENPVILKRFNLDVERSIPSLYTLVLWLLCIALLSFIAYYKKKDQEPYKYWLGMVVLFVFLSVDEFISIHETLSPYMYHMLNASGLLFYTWVVLYFVALVILGLVYLRFMIGLPAKTRNLFIFALLLFVSGAIGVEMLEGRYVEMYGRTPFFYLFLITLEEILEMVGLVVFIYALGSYINSELGILQIRTGPPQVSSSSQ
jgi:hypothetical protein